MEPLDIMDDKNLTIKDLERILDSRLEPIKNDISAIKTDLTAIKKHIGLINERLHKLESKL